MNTSIKYDKEAREALKRGVDAVAEAVKVSLGPEGRNVVIPRNTNQGIAYEITKDGVSIAQSILPNNIFEAIGASMIKEAARRTNNYAGDGTTTATVIAQAIFSRGLHLISQDRSISSVELKKGIDQAAKDIVAALENSSTRVSKVNLEAVATISTNGDAELGKIIAKAFNKIGKHGTVITSISDTADTYVELRDGVQLDRGWYHPAFVTDRIKDICELENPLVLLNKGKLEKGDATVNLFKAVFKDPNNSLLIITDDVDPFVLSNLVKNSTDGPIRGKICIVTSPQILKIEKQLLSDIATLTGAKVVGMVEGVKLAPSALGRIKKCVISEKESLLIGDSDNLTELVQEIKTKISNTKNKFDKQELQERLSRITGGVATLYVGAKSDSELAEKQDRVEDAINATRSALEEGIVPGGGIALMNIATTLNNVESPSYWDRVLRFLGIRKKKSANSFDIGYNLVINACMAPVNQILSNAGLPLVDKNSVIWDAPPGVGIDVKTGQRSNMIEAGIIDPTKVTRFAIENAASVAGTFLTTEAVVAVVES